MFTLARQRFPDLLLGLDDLDDVARLWRTWHDQRWGASLESLHTYEAIRLRLWGCPRRDSEQFAHKLEERLQAERIDARVSVDDPDYLVVTGPFEHSADSCPFGAWLKVVNERAFDGLVAFFELSIRDWPGPPEGPAVAGGTIVLCGQLEAKGFRLKAVWPVGLEPGVENLYKQTVWPHEPAFLRALESFRTGGVPAPGSNYFASRPAQQRGTWIAKLVIHVPGRGSFRTGRLSSVLFRIAFYSCFAVADFLLYMQLPAGPAGALFLTLLVLPLAMLAYVTSAELARIWTLYWRMRAALKRLYSRSAQYELVNPADYGLDTDANANKYTRELKALGCQHLADVRHQPATSGTIVNRVFVLPGARTYVFLNVMTSTGNFQKFPAHIFYLIVTHLTDGRVMTINEGGGYRQALNPNTFTRRCPEVHDPATLLAKHQKFVAEICARGREAAPLADLPELLERMKAAHEENRPLMEQYGYYSWEAAFRQSFELVRKEYLEPDAVARR